MIKQPEDDKKANDPVSRTELPPAPAAIPTSASDLVSGGAAVPAAGGRVGEAEVGVENKVPDTKPFSGKDDSALLAQIDEAATIPTRKDDTASVQPPLPPAADEASDPNNETTLEIPKFETQVCPVCASRYRVGELACSQCGFVFTPVGKTHKIDESSLETPDKKSWPTGEVLATEQKPITFELNGQTLTVMIAETMTVGRSSNVAGDVPPDIDLGPYNAEEMGVSRRHLRIRRKGILLYVADLNSMNGTLLNGRRLIPEGERLIRSGDELRLGHLKVRVRF